MGQQREQRKRETEAIVPQFTELRTEAQFRFNRMHRLWQAYQQAVLQVLPDHSNLPLAFGYEEGDPPHERVVCRLWDRRSFVLHSDHAYLYSTRTVSHARRKLKTFTDALNEVFQTSTGEPVILKAHLLRHAFATFAVHVEGLPLDLVAEWLKQKNLDTTRYYSQKDQQDVAEEHASFVERLATEINIREAIVRSPEEIQKLAESARRRVGTLIGVCGGDCTFDGWCHNQFDCIRCPSKAPDPEKRSHVEEKLRNAEDRLTYYEREGLVLEAEKMRSLIRNCHLELREMDLMAEYKRDQSRAAPVTFYPRKTQK